ncbi:glycoside hydrolase family 9 protein [Cytophagaceae bacterium ABcell3]|nr:glycoside hydrolase family 9 protein [Cytophagaceae bacterium ABcell3]
MKNLFVFATLVCMAFSCNAPEKQEKTRDVDADLEKILKGTEPLTLRWIKAQTESWSDLSVDQIIAQKTIKPILAHGGYEPWASKKAVIWTNNEEYTGKFEIIDVQRNSQPPAEPIVYTGELKKAGNHIWGGNNLIADFSDFKTPGLYKLRLRLNETYETTDSYYFPIKENLYAELAEKAADWFAYQKCGVEVEGWYEACHLNDAKLESEEKCVTGGWHDAGDYNKWPTYTPPPLVALSMLYEEQYHHKEENKKGREILDELAWELSFLCKVQKDDGTFYSIISKEDKPWLWAGVPELEEQRVGVNFNVGNGDPASISSGIKIGAAVLKSAIHLKQHYPELADSSLNLTKKVYDRAIAVDYNTKEYEQDKQDYLSIQSALLSANLSLLAFEEDEKYEKDAEKRAEAILKAQSPEGIFYSDYDQESKAYWPDMYLTALYDYYHFTENDRLKKSIEEAFINYSNFYVTHAEKSAFGHTGKYENNEFSLIMENKTAGYNAWALAFTYSLTGDEKYRETAVHNFNWILGYNPADVSMMAGVGFGPGAYHHRYTSIPGHEDGIVPGGVLNGIKAGTGDLLFLGDEGAENFVIGYYLPKDYPAIDTDARGWTYAWWPNEYHIPNNAYFIMAANMLSQAGKK